MRQRASGFSCLSLEVEALPQFWDVEGLVCAETGRSQRSAEACRAENEKHKSSRCFFHCHFHFKILEQHCQTGSIVPAKRRSLVTSDAG